jgi:hypothetical protein
MPSTSIRRRQRQPRKRRLRKAPPPDPEPVDECDYCYEPMIATVRHGDKFSAQVCGPHLDFMCRCVEFAA